MNSGIPFQARARDVIAFFLPALVVVACVGPCVVGLVWVAIQVVAGK